MRRFILSDTQDKRVNALNKIKQYQKEDFETILKLSGERPTIIRLLDPPLHEFYLTQQRKNSVASQLNVSVAELDHYMESLNEVNPMLGASWVSLGDYLP